MQQYDIVLIMEYFRSIPYYLSIIKYLSPMLRICVYQVDMEPSLQAKNKNAQAEFAKLCRDFGADVNQSVKISTKLMIIPQRTFLEEAQADILKNINSENNIGVLALAWAGFKKADDFIQQFQIQKLLAIDLGLVKFLLEARGLESSYASNEVSEVGYPFGKYPVFEDFQADYMLAIPTPFSFAHERDKWAFLETVIKLFRSIDDQDTIVFKSHNGMDREQLASSNLRALAKIINNISILSELISKKVKGNTAIKQTFLGKLYTAMLFEKIMSRIIPIEEFTESHQVGIEAFMPGVKKGIIGGLSNTIYASLFFKLPYYNCVDIKSQDRDAPNKLYGEKIPSTTIELNLRYFGVPFCDGELNYDDKNYDLLSESTRQVDMIEEIKLAHSQLGSQTIQS